MQPDKKEIKEHVAIIIKKGDDVLFIKRSMEKKTLPGAWSFPSGTVEEGETVYETSRREAEEELGIDISTEKILAIKELPEFSAKLVFVLCSIKNGNPIVKEPKEIEEIEFMNFNDFFRRFSDDNIGHGLIWLRKNPEIWGDL